MKFKTMVTWFAAFPPGFHILYIANVATDIVQSGVIRMTAKRGGRASDLGSRISVRPPRSTNLSVSIVDARGGLEPGLVCAPARPKVSGRGVF
jgi:hypothetical protein